MQKHFSVFDYMQLFHSDKWLRYHTVHVPTCHLVIHFCTEKLTVKGQDLPDTVITVITTWCIFFFFFNAYIPNNSGSSYGLLTFWLSYPLAG